MPFKCCCSNSDGDSVSNKSWTPGVVNKSFDTVENKQPHAVTNQPRSSDSTPTNTMGRPSTASNDSETFSKIDLNLNIFEKDRFTDMSKTIHKSQMNLNDI
ncbi:uncharacterized protein LOC106087099 [Stomoxys calcitrans]|uniref:uncharacterized protein LOC106087099 n=1 Tax=Stomoxys calcitrans TaxID=35570 RepID=UPI0027E29A95|nr:uncharacterized protein LOC106087099 [Stomoxys calcitrans]